MTPAQKGALIHCLQETSTVVANITKDLKRLYAAQEQLIQVFTKERENAG